MKENIIIGLLGVVFITLLRLRSLKKDAQVANMKFSYGKYFEDEALGIAMSLVSLAIWYYLYPEAKIKYPALENWIRFSFFTSGALGAWALQRVLGKTKETIRNVVDTKTDIADGKAIPNDN